MTFFSGGIKGFSRVLKKARLEAGLTQSELSRRSGIHIANISRWEAGTREPGVLKLQRLLPPLGEHARPLLKEIGYAP